MTKRSSIGERLERLENEHRFLTWVEGDRFINSLTASELDAIVRENRLPDPVPNRPTTLDGLDRESLLKRWNRHELTFGYRSSEDFKHFCTHGRWPEQLGELKYALKNGSVVVEWQSEREADKLETKSDGRKP